MCQRGQTSTSINTFKLKTFVHLVSNISCNTFQGMQLKSNFKAQNGNRTASWVSIGKSVTSKRNSNFPSRGNRLETWNVPGTSGGPDVSEATGVIASCESGRAPPRPRHRIFTAPLLWLASGDADPDLLTTSSSPPQIFSFLIFYLLFPSFLFSSSSMLESSILTYCRYRKAFTGDAGG